MSVKNIWWEIYRPKTLAGFYGQSHMIEEFRAIIEEDAPMQNYLFHSKEPGTGKTTLANILATQLGYEIYRFNASSKRTRGIEFIEEDIIPLSRMGLSEAIIFLDEADRLTVQAQDALKGVIEESSCFFVLTCNDISRVSTWLQSRCQVRTFQPIPHDDVVKRLAMIASIECQEVDDATLNILAKAHKGDLRNSIGALQTYCSSPTDRSKQQFLLSLTVSSFDHQTFLKRAMGDMPIDASVRMIMEHSTTPRKVIESIFDFAMQSPAKPKSKMIIIQASVQAERDIISGVRESIAVHEYVRSIKHGSV